MRGNINLKQKTAHTAEPETYSITDHPLHYLAAIQRLNQANLARLLLPLDLTPHSWRVLALLSDGVGRTIGEIADIVVIDRSNLGRLLETMAQDGLVERAPSELDRRISLTRLTRTGINKFRAALPLVRRSNKSLLADISPEEFATLMDILRKMKRNAVAASSEMAADHAADRSSDGVGKLNPW